MSLALSLFPSGFKLRWSKNFFFSNKDTFRTDKERKKRNWSGGLSRVQRYRFPFSRYEFESRWSLQQICLKKEKGSNNLVKSFSTFSSQIFSQCIIENGFWHQGDSSYNSNTDVVMVKWSACSPSTLSIWIRILLKPTIFLEIFFWKEQNKQKEAGVGPLKNSNTNNKRQVRSRQPLYLLPLQRSKSLNLYTMKTKNLERRQRLDEPPSGESWYWVSQLWTGHLYSGQRKFWLAYRS